jgi:hypothetical protein
MLALMTHYGYLFLSLAISAVFLAGAIVGFLIGMAAFRTRAAIDARSGVSAELRGLQELHRADLGIIRRQGVRLSTQKAQFAEITDHLARAIEAMK